MDRTKWAYVCFSLALLIPTVLGLIYLVMPTLMPFHLAAMSDSWDAVKPEYQVIFLTLMKGTGGGLLSVGIILGVILFVPFRRGKSGRGMLFFGLSYFRRCCRFIC